MWLTKLFVLLLYKTAESYDLLGLIHPGSECACKLLAFTIYFHALSLTKFFLSKEKMHFGRLCKLRVRQWTVNPSPPLTTVWSPYSMWSKVWSPYSVRSPYWFLTGNSMSVIQCCHYKVFQSISILSIRKIVIDDASDYQNDRIGYTQLFVAMPKIQNKSGKFEVRFYFFPA